MENLIGKRVYYSDGENCRVGIFHLINGVSYIKDYNGAMYEIPENVSVTKI